MFRLFAALLLVLPSSASAQFRPAKPQTVGMLRLIPLMPSATGLGDKEWLEVYLDFLNLSDSRKIDLEPWARQMKKATLTDDLGNTYKRLASGFNTGRGLVQEVSLHPEKTVLGHFNFEVPVRKAKSLTLRFSSPDGVRLAFTFTVP